MRPRVFPAEDLTSSKMMRDWSKLASMRPRVFPAEDPDRCRASRGGDWSFNEAAGIPRGRPPTWRRADPCHRGFNEAAGIPRGRPMPWDTDTVRVVAASMRPRVFPAEDRSTHDYRRGEDAASMRPRVFPAEDGVGIGDRAGRVERASMRPRVFPAEDSTR